LVLSLLENLGNLELILGLLEHLYYLWHLVLLLHLELRFELLELPENL
jgi:hypothetical protein